MKSDGKKIAIVTGGGTGIGRAVTRALVADGWTVAIAGRRAEPLAETVALLGGDAARVLPVTTDIADPEQVKALFETVHTRFGRLDLLFNNAGSNAPNVPIDELSVADWRRVVDINLTGAFLCAQQAFRFMKDQDPRGGRIINNGSIAAHVPRPRSVAYTATKHAITGLTRQCSLDGRAYDIACGQIDIGNAGTEMALAQSVGAPQANGSVMVEPLIDVGLIADAVVHMAGLPLSANVQFMTLMATKMPYIGRG
jgi:NAD(P)-dependent dehydrogenase (short-subunit alcohol dehydrogenase family)